jgi:glycosyltransferase involved in cell wall biosynthesis
MKILYFIHQFYPKDYTGTEKFVLHLATMMQLFGHNVKVITFDRHNGKFSKKHGDIYIHEYLYHSISVTSFRFKQFNPNQNILLENEKIHDFSQDIFCYEKPDIVHVAHVQKVGEFVSTLITLGIPYVITLTDFWLLCPNSILVTSEGNLCLGPDKGSECFMRCPQYEHQMIVNRLKIAERYLTHAQKVVAPSSFLGNIFLREYPDLNIRVIPYGMNYNNIQMNTKTYHNDQPIVIGYAGSFQYHKGVHVLINAFKKLQNDTLMLKIYGSFGLEAELRDLARGDQRIQFCGVFSEDQISEFFNSTDLLVVPSLWHENNTMIMREALSHNVPVVVSNVGGMTEMVKNGVNGFTFKVGNSEDLKRVLEKIVETPKTLNTIKNNIQFDLPITMEQEAYLYEREYRKCLSSHQ